MSTFIEDNEPLARTLAREQTPQHTRIATLPGQKRVVEHPPQPPFMASRARGLGRQIRMGAGNPSQHQAAGEQDTHDEKEQALAGAAWQIDRAGQQQGLDRTRKIAYTSAHGAFLRKLAV